MSHEVLEKCVRLTLVAPRETGERVMNNKRGLCPQKCFISGISYLFDG